MDKKTPTYGDETVYGKPSDGSVVEPTPTNKIEIPTVSLPKGGGAVKGLDEKFEVNAVNGTTNLSIPFPISAARGFAPSLGVSYNSGGGNGVFGMGWSLNLPSVRRKTEKELPQYQDSTDSDTFLFSGIEDLVPKLKKMGGIWKSDEYDSPDGQFTIKLYRPRIEGGFARIERWTKKSSSLIHWKVISKDNTTSIFGNTPSSKITDPSDPLKTFEWLLDFTYDDKGNCAVYEFTQENATGITPALHNKNRTNGNAPFANTYLKRIRSGNVNPYRSGDAIPPVSQFLFESVLDYGEHDKLTPPFNELHPWTFRPDAFSDYRAGFEIRTCRLCLRVLRYHHFPELPGGSALVSSLDFIYDNNGQIGNFTFLKEISSKGYLKHANNTYTHKVLPPTSFSYQKHEWNKDVKHVDVENLIDLPAGIHEPSYQWVDLYSEGLSGVLTEQATGVFYKQNLGNGVFSPAKLITSKPSFTGIGINLQIQELEADGTKYLSGYNGMNPGFFKITDEDEWQPFKPFQQVPNIDFNDPNTRLLDLNGDGKADVLITEDQVLTWYPSVGERGFDELKRIWKSIDEEKGPNIVFNDKDQSIFLSDMNGDGLTDIVQIKNGSVCYWPNLGYGNFGAKVAMDNAPYFDHPDQFNSSLIKLADVDGSGTTDIIYLGQNQFKVWLNQSGNSFLPKPEEINPFPEGTNFTQVSVIDFLGNGTSCILWSSTQPKDYQQSLKYIDLMASKKPHLMIGYKNNMGKEVELTYTASTHYYLQDKLSGNPWITKLPFPVHCVSKVVTFDRIMKTRLASEYSYHHGYYDHAESEFRGFGRVEQKDAEDIAHFTKQSGSAMNNLIQQDLHQPPVLTKTWFHTGAFLDRKKITNQFAHEYAKNLTHPENILPEPELPDGLSTEEWRQALRTCKTMMLRKEIYALDSTPFSHKPYSVQQQNCFIKSVQPMQVNKYASFVVLTSESISYQYERDDTDPRVIHSFTLEIDEFADIKKSASTVYARKPTTGGNPPHPPEQSTGYISYTENEFTTQVDANSDYRTPILYETKLLEVTGMPLLSGNYYTLPQIRNACAAAASIDYDTIPNGTLQKRLVEWSRTQFKADDGITVLPFGTMHAKALAHQTFQAAFNPTQLINIFSTKISFPNLSTMLLDPGKGGYILSDNYFWIPSASPQYDTSNFFLPVSFTDSFGNITQIHYDNAYHLYIEKKEDALNNETSVKKFNYRVLQPYILQDANDNLSGVRFDELGVAVKFFSVGKKGFDPGDELDVNSMESSLSDSPSFEIEYHFFEWFNQSANTSFDINNYKPKPNYIRTKTRETHYHADPLHQTKVQESYTYFGGSGTEILKKTQANPGEALQINPDYTTTLIADTSPNLRWVGNGRTILNNKGKPVKKYESYFSINPGFDDEKEMVELGVTPVFHYDPLGRAIQTDFPDRTFAKVEFTSWLQKSFDQNDTVVQSGWYEERIISPDAAVATPEEISAAQKAYLHNNTPTVLHLDTLGRPFLIETDNVTEKITNHVKRDIEGKELEISDTLGRTVIRYEYDLAGRIMKQLSIDAGARWKIFDAGNNPLISWDQRDHEFSVDYDALRRPIASMVKKGIGSKDVFEKTVYGESLPPGMAKAANLRMVPYKVYDQSGILTTNKRDFKGNLLESSKQLAIDYKGMIDWTNLEDEIFTGSLVYDALNRPLKIITPHSSTMSPSEIYPAYNKAGLLEKMNVKIRGAAAITPFVTNIHYDAKGQREQIFYNNGTKTTFTYDKRTFRLVNLKTTRNPGPTVLQDLKYTYDPVGNITRIKDDAHADIFFDNEQVSALNDYTYDAIYHLKAATGRKHAGQTDIQPKATLSSNTSFRNHPFINSGFISPNDTNAFRNYTEHYLYDKVGNMKEQKHVAKNSGWTRTFEYDNNNNHNNRLTKTSINSQDYHYTYDSHGNMHGLETVISEVWDFIDHFKEAGLGGGGRVYYVYDSGGQRVRKVIERPNGTKKERIYLNGIEIYREWNNAVITHERETLHVMDNQRRIAMVDTTTVRTGGNIETEIIRYQYDNHLGSASLELDELAQIISYEEYFPYGTISYSATDNSREVPPKRYRYSGKERDGESGLNYHGARYYAAWLARWTKCDPKGEAKLDNLYTYCHNNPVILFDPDGKEAILTIDEQSNTLTFKTTVHLYASTKAEEKRLNKIAKDAKAFYNNPVVATDAAVATAKSAGKPIPNSGTGFTDPATGKSWSIKFDVDYKVHGSASPVKEVIGQTGGQKLYEVSTAGVQRDNIQVGDNTMSLIYQKTKTVGGRVNNATIGTTKANATGELYYEKGVLDEALTRRLIHETGHFLGLDDRYDPVTASFIQGGYADFVSDFMGADDNTKGRTVVVNPIHIEEIGKFGMQLRSQAGALPSGTTSRDFLVSGHMDDTQGGKLHPTAASYGAQQQTQWQNRATEVLTNTAEWRKSVASGSKSVAPHIPQSFITTIP